MKENYTPSEYFNAADKAKQHEKGREEAKFYRNFLDFFRNKVVSKLLQKDINEGLGDIDIDKTDLPLSKFRFCDSNSLMQYINEAMKEANQIAGTSIKSIRVNTETMANMTPIEFHKYIEELKESLIKE